jgi:hypothetical protein
MAFDVLQEMRVHKQRDGRVGVAESVLCCTSVIGAPFSIMADA